LCSPSNKTSLIKFLVEQWKLPRYRQMLHGKVLYATYEESCYKVTVDECDEVAELHCTLEEADTRLILHAVHAANDGLQSAIIITEDTDVMMFVLHFRRTLPVPSTKDVGCSTEHGLPTSANWQAHLGTASVTALFTGCDTVSAFASRGKLNALLMVRKDTSCQEAFSRLGQSWNVNDELFQKIEQF